MDDGTKRLARLIDDSRRVVAFTGAGISTESGIPDFRSPGGLWTKAQPIDFQDFLASEEMRRESWRRKIVSEATTSKAQPNRGHYALAHLHAAGKLSSIITQNVDGLHQHSGVPAGRVIELHGNATYAACLDCQARVELEPILEVFRQREELPVCGDCGGIVKTATISFGQPMPEEAMRLAQDETADCDLFLAIGSSLVVYPAAGFPALAKDYGARLVILNREPTPLDDLADLALHAEIGPTLAQVVAAR
jgi:NAD-dependent deacetylase